MGRCLWLSALIISSTLAAYGAAAQERQPSLDLPDKEKRKLLAPLIRVATDCIAKSVQPKDTANEPDPARVLSAISEGIARCPEQIATMSAEHDRLYGPGTGLAFVNGAYLQDLPRAVLARVSPQAALSPPTCNPNQLVLGPVTDPDGFSLSVERKRQDGPWTLRIAETGETYLFRLWRKASTGQEFLVPATEEGQKTRLAAEIRIFADRAGKIGAVEIAKLAGAFSGYHRKLGREGSGSDVPPDGHWTVKGCGVVAPEMAVVTGGASAKASEPKQADMPQAQAERPLEPETPAPQFVTPDVAFPYLARRPKPAEPRNESTESPVGTAPQQSAPEQTAKVADGNDDATIRAAYDALNRADYPRALDLLRPLARSGRRIALHNMGVMFANGQGLPRDAYAAQALFRMAAQQNYAPSFRSLGLTFAYGEGVQVDLIEAYKWFELARRQVEREGSHSPEWSMLEDLNSVQEKLSAALTTKQLDDARGRADRWRPDAWMHEASKQLLQGIKTLQDYNQLCQPYAGIRKGIRDIDDMIRVEAVNTRFDLLTCIAVIEYSWTMKDCDGRKPVISEILYYLRALALKPEVTSHLPATASVATALVIGGYCKPNQPQPASTEPVYARLRQAYETGAEPRLAEEAPPPKL